MLSHRKCSAWYRDNYKAPRRAQKKRRWPLALLIVILVLSLLAGTALVLQHTVFAPKAPAAPAAPAAPSGTVPPQSGVLPEIGLPDITLPDIFSEYYQQPTETPKSYIARIAPRGDFRVTLASAEGREALSLQQLYIDCAPSIVSVEAFPDADSPKFYSGSGIILSEDGYILTNQHVISETVRAEIIMSDGTRYDAQLVGEDHKTDLAVLKIEASGLPAAEFGDSGELLVGDSATAIGSPLGSELSGTMTTGIISAINRNMDMNGRNMTLLQHTAAINSGSSGGALINSYGQVIGVTNMKLVGSYSVATVEGLSFAIPSSTVKSVADSIITNGKMVGRPGIGITVGAVTDAMRERFGYPNGLYISVISEGSDAAAKGLRVGDILLEVDGEAVLIADDLLHLRDKHAVGDTMHFLVWREGETFEVNVRIVDLADLY